jgi:hypothetical protein
VEALDHRLDADRDAVTTSIAATLKQMEVE